MRIPFLAGLVLSAFFMFGCVRRVQIEPIGYEIVTTYPAGESAYSLYPSLATGGPRDIDTGPWLVGYFDSGSNIRSMARRHEMSHLGYSLFQCPEPSPHDSPFYIDLVFNLSAADVERLGPRARKDAFKVYVPVNLYKEIERSPFLHWPEEEALVASSIRTNGLCLEFNAGSMLGFGLYSNTVQIPVAIQGLPLKISDIAVDARLD